MTVAEDVLFHGGYSNLTLEGLSDPSIGMMICLFQISNKLKSLKYFHLKWSKILSTG